ncbi:MAG: hypothetical protein HEQ24_01110 [Dolichospermum sp. BR01]|jgi:hypothetical protein|nr:hypothetical protein [Dolichospermum sp. BR01]
MINGEILKAVKTVVSELVELPVPFFIPCLKHERRNFVPVSQGLSSFPGYLVTIFWLILA